MPSIISLLLLSYGHDYSLKLLSSSPMIKVMNLNSSFEKAMKIKTGFFFLLCVKSKLSFFNFDIMVPNASVDILSNLSTPVSSSKETLLWFEGVNTELWNFTIRNSYLEMETSLSKYEGSIIFTENISFCLHKVESPMT